MADLLKKIIYTGVGIVTTASEKLQKNIEDISDKGDETQEEGRKIFDEILDTTEAKREEVEGKVKDIVTNIMKSLNIPTKDEFNQLVDRLGALEDAMGKTPAKAKATAKRSTSRAKTAARKTTSRAKKTVTSRAKKTTARAKTTAKKATTAAKKTTTTRAKSTAKKATSTAKKTATTAAKKTTSRAKTTAKKASTTAKTTAKKATNAVTAASKEIKK